MHFGWWVVATTFMAQLFMIGLYTYAWSLLAPEVAKEFGADMLTMNLVMSGAGLMGLALPPFVGVLVDRWSARWLMVIGATSLLLALLGMSVASSITIFVVVAALFMGVAAVLLGPITGSAVITRWFTEKRGRALGISAIGTSAGGILLPQVMGWGFDAVGWRQTLQLIALGVAFVVIPMLLFLFRDHPDSSPDATGDSEVTASRTDAKDAEHGDGVAGSLAEILRRGDFWVLTISLAFFIMCYTSTLANIGAFFDAELGLEASQTGNWMSLLAFFGFLGKLFVGELIDRISLRLVMWAGIGATILGLGILSSEPSGPLLWVVAIALGLATGGILPVWNAMVAAVFGVAKFGRVMGLMGPAIGLVVTPGFTVAGAIRESTGSYVAVFQLFMAVLVGSSLLLGLLRIPASEAES